MQLIEFSSKQSFEDFSENVLYISLIFVLHVCCIPFETEHI